MSAALSSLAPPSLCTPKRRARRPSSTSLTAPRPYAAQNHAEPGAASARMSAISKRVQVMALTRRFIAPSLSLPLYHIRRKIAIPAKNFAMSREKPLTKPVRNDKLSRPH